LLAWRELTQFRQGPRGHKRTAVKVVDTTHILVAQLTADIGARHFQRGQYRSQKITPCRLAVVLRYLLLKRRRLDYGSHSVVSEQSAAMGGAANLCLFKPDATTLLSESRAPLTSRANNRP
jgi:hypothetical protein